MILYSVEIEKILLYLRFPRFLNAAKALFDETGKLIIQEIIKHGAIPMSIIVQNLVEQSEYASLNTTESDVRKVFSDLVEGHYLYRLSQEEEEGSNEKMQFVLPPEGEYIGESFETHLIPSKGNLPMVIMYAKSMTLNHHRHPINSY